MSTNGRPLDGIRVLSLEMQVAGPYCSMMLADQGAEVIKVERPGSGDTARGGAPMVSGPSGEKQSGYFLRFNRNKRSLTLDLKQEEAREVVRKLAAEVDVVIENYRPGLLAGMGLGYDGLRSVNERLIYASISGFGTLDDYRGEFASRPAYDIVVQAMSGLMHTCGQAGGPPTWLGIALGDIGTGMNAAHAIVLALFDRERTGRGRYLDVSMYDSMVALAERSVTACSLTGHVLERGNEPYMAPWGAFQTADGWVALVVATERDWEKFCAAIDRPDLVGREDTKSGPARAAHMDGQVGDIIRAWFAGHSTEEVSAKLLGAGIAVGPVQTSQEVLDCAHLQSRQLFIDLPDPVLGTARLVGPPVKVSDAPPPRAEPAPRLGEHTDAVLADLGFDAEQISQLRDSKAV